MAAGTSLRRMRTFNPIPDSALFVLLPLWPKGTNAHLGSDGQYEVPLEERQPLLVCYRREEAQKHAHH